MPGYQPVRIVPPSDYFSKNEPLYGHTKSKKKSKKTHPLFDDIKARHGREKMEYERFLKSREMVRADPSGHRFDSLKLLGSCNDLNYLDSFMSMPRQRQTNFPEEPDPRVRVRPLAKSSTAVFGKGDKKNSIHSDSTAVTAAMLSSLRHASSEDNLYESMEMIHYMKTMQSINKQKKTRSLQKSGHPLFDSLREEQAMKEPPRKTSTTRRPVDEQALQGMRSQEYTMMSDGNSPSPSSSSSGDEFEIYPRVNAKASRSGRQKVMQPLPERRPDSNLLIHTKRGGGGADKPKRNDAFHSNGSESDDEFKIIPRPKFFGGRGTLMQQQQPSSAMGQQPLRRRSDGSAPSDESDSSFNSAVLR